MSVHGNGISPHDSHCLEIIARERRTDLHRHQPRVTAQVPSPDFFQLVRNPFLPRGEVECLRRID
jgi:hypothetical protein